MPQLKTIDLTVGSTTYSYLPRSNDKGLATFTVSSDTLRTADSLAIGVRPVAAKQMTRKASMKMTEPLVCVPDACGTIVDRGSNIANFELTVSRDSTLVERTLIYDKFVASLADPSVRAAFINNEAFYS